MDENKTDEKLQLNIFGSCVSRDVLEVQKERKILLQTYIARESIVSAVSPSVVLDEDKLNLDSNFQRRMIMHDFQKDAFELFRSNQSDFILVDFIDERFPLVKLGHSYVTYSNELMVSRYIKKPKLVELRKSISSSNWFKKEKEIKWKIDKKDMDQFINLFCQQLLDLYKPEQIIVHEVYLSDTYISRDNKACSFPKNHLKNNKLLNEKYKYLYNKFKEYIPNVRVIHCSHDYMADENNKWGLSPMHFQKEYYERVLEELIKIMEI